MGIAAVTGIYSGTFRVPRRKAFTVQQENQVKEEEETFFYLPFFPLPRKFRRMGKVGRLV